VPALASISAVFRRAPLPLSSRTMKQACTKTKSPQTFGLLDGVGGGAGVPALFLQLGAVMRKSSAAFVIGVG
jgi:hypothetical protein